MKLIPKPQAQLAPNERKETKYERESMKEREGSVEIIIGSDSDRQAMDGCINILNALGIPWELSVLSAHRHKDALAERLAQLVSKSISVIICAAGWSAALPGDVAAQICGKGILVIGVALPSAEFPNAIDALLAMCRVPADIPVVCSGIGAGGAKNAALVAGELLCNAGDVTQQTLLNLYRSLEKKKPAGPGCEKSPPRA